jgi:phage terminase large subunit
MSKIRPTAAALALAAALGTPSPHALESDLYARAPFADLNLYSEVTDANPTKNLDTFILPYEPRDAFIPFHNRNQRWSFLVCHRRAGKTVACVNELVMRSLRTQKKNAKYAYLAPFYSQAKSIAWVYLKEAVQDVAIDIRESELSISLPNGATIRLFGADNPNAIRGLYFDGIILDEMADIRPSLWQESILPTLADRQGWCVVIGTPKGKGNLFYRIRELARKNKQSWFFQELKASNSGLLPQAELDNMREQMSEEAYQQEFEVSFTAALVGTYYSKQIAKMEAEGRVHLGAEYDSAFEVQVAFDIGYRDTMVAWFWQERPDGVAVFDVEAASQESLDFYFDMLDAKPYTYEKVWLPHDARAKSLQTGKSTIEQFLERGYPCDIVPQLKVQQGIDAARATLPYIHMHPRCDEGMEALRVYRKKWDEINQRFIDKPLHDWSSDYADSFRYLCLVANKANPIAVPQNDPNDITKRHLSSYTLDDLFTSRPQSTQSARLRIK